MHKTITSTLNWSQKWVNWKSNLRRFIDDTHKL
jgi:hypothetical protein